MKASSLSPFLFLLVVEGLIMLIKVARRRGEIKWIKISYYVVILYFLFLDDIVIFGDEKHKEDSLYILKLQVWTST
jgi:hypothetical protein